MAKAPIDGKPQNLDVEILREIFHEWNESHAWYCVHDNQHLGGKECGRMAKDFLQSYTERWIRTYGND